MKHHRTLAVTMTATIMALATRCGIFSGVQHPYTPAFDCSKTVQMCNRVINPCDMNTFSKQASKRSTISTLGQGPWGWISIPVKDLKVNLAKSPISDLKKITHSCTKSQHFNPNSNWR